MSDLRPTTYRDAGVDIDAGDELVERIKPAVKRSMRPEVLGGLGGFGALVEVPLDRYRQPVMVSGTDGVGTKLRLAIETGRHDTIGIDLVAMCVNDVVVQGAEPIFFLDYYATGSLQVAVAERVIKGIVEGCLQAGCALVGGETAEMPGMYEGDDYDLAGFCVGLVEKDRIIDGSRTRTPATELDGRPLYDLLLAPTRIYVKSVLALLAEVPVHGIAHITGGGPTGNIPRTLPDGLEAVIEERHWPRPAVFDWLQRVGSIERDEMHRTFNCGLGMTITVPAADADRALAILRRRGEQASVIGEVRAGSRGAVIER